MFHSPNRETEVTEKSSLGLSWFQGMKCDNGVEDAIFMAFMEVVCFRQSFIHSIPVVMVILILRFLFTISLFFIDEGHSNWK